MMGITKNRLIVVGVALVMLAGCRSQVEDKAPAAQALPVEQPRALTAIDLLPTHSMAIGAYQVEKYRHLRHTSPIPEELLQMTMPAVSSLVEILLEESLDGLDSTGRVYLAANRQGFEDVLSGLRLGSPQVLSSMNEYFPHVLHLRVVAPATDAATLKAALQTRCDELASLSPCEDIRDISTRDSFVVIDLTRHLSGYKEVRRDLEFEIEEGFDGNNSAAFKAFIERDSPVALYATMEGLFDQLALIDLEHVVQAVEYHEDSFGHEALSARGLALIAQEFTYDSADVAETTDVALFLDQQGGIVFLDALASLTEYGQRLVDAISEAAPMSGRSKSQAAFDLRWGLDLTRTIEASTRPLWAQDIEGMEAATFARVIQGQVRESTWGFPLGVFRSPITGYALFDEFVSAETTPAEFSMIRGFWLQVFGVKGSEIETAMGLHLPADAPMDAFETFASVALRPFGYPIDSRLIEAGAEREFQAATAGTTADFFTDEEHRVEPGVQMFLNLRSLAEVFRDLREFDGLGVREFMVLNMLANLGAPQIHLAANFGEGQGLVRLQWGGDELIPLQPVEGAQPPRALAPDSQCLFTAREWSILGLSELADVSEEQEHRSQLIDEVATALATFAEDCDEVDAQKVRQLSSEWRRLER